MKRAIQTAMRAGAKGIKISVSGRLSGVEIAKRNIKKDVFLCIHSEQILTMRLHLQTQLMV